MKLQRLLKYRVDRSAAAVIREMNAQRRAEIERHLTQLTPYRGRLRILDAGCGSNRKLRFPDRSFVVGIDRSKKQLLRNSGLHAAVAADLESYQFAPESFDVILCWDVLEHLSHPLAAMERMADSLAPGGLLIIGSPNLWSLKGLVTRFTPHRFHIWFYRHVHGNPDAGKDDVAPFPTVLSRAMAPPGIRRFAEARGATVLRLETFDGDQQVELRQRYPVSSVIFEVLGSASRLLTGGRLDLSHSDYIAVLRASSERRAVGVRHSPGLMPERPLTVALVGQTPPPYNGYTLMTAYTLQGDFEGVELHHVPTRFSREIHEFGHFSLRKVAHLVVVVLRIAATRARSHASVLYYSPAGPQRVPVYRDLVVLLSTRWMFRHTIFHFHAGGVSALYPRMNVLLRTLFRLAYFDADVGIRTSALAPEDPKVLRAKREAIVPNGIPEEAGLSRPPGAKDPTKPTILFVGALSVSKGVPLLLEASLMLRDRGLRFTVELVGDFASSSTEEWVQEFLDRHDLRDLVRVRGVLTGDEKHSAQASASIFCLPTSFHSEAFPLVLLEAMQAATPIVATRWRGIPSIVIEGVNGLLVEPGDARALADALGTLVEDPQLAREMGRGGRQIYEERFTLTSFYAALQAVFDLLPPERLPRQRWRSGVEGSPVASARGRGP